MKDGKLQLNLDDEIIRETLVTQGGEVVNAAGARFLLAARAGLRG